MKFKSRKFIVAAVQLGITILLPPIYKLLEIDSDVTLICLTMSSGLTAMYLGVNVMSKGKDGSVGKD